MRVLTKRYITEMNSGEVVKESGDEEKEDGDSAKEDGSGEEKSEGESETQKGGGSEEEGNWSDVSPSKQGRSMLKINGDTNGISSPSRFAVLSDEQEESGSNVQEEEEVSEEGEIPEDRTHTNSENHSQAEEKQVVVDDANARRTSTQTSKSLAKNVVDTKSRGASNLASAGGRKRNTKRN